MKTSFAFCTFGALLVPLATAAVTVAKIQPGAPTPASAQKAPASQPARHDPARADELAALERMLLGAWRGAACAGNYTFNPDGTFECRHFTPGGNTLTGTWSLRWDALPPTLVLTCRTSDFTKKDPTRPEYEFLGKPRELRVLELNRDSFVYGLPNDKHEWRNWRPGAE